MRKKKTLEESSAPIRFANWLLKNCFDIRFRSPAFRLRIQYCPVSDYASIWGPDGYSLGTPVNRHDAEQFVRRTNAYEPLVDALALIMEAKRKGLEEPFSADDIQNLLDRVATAPLPTVVIR